MPALNEYHKEQSAPFLGNIKKKNVDFYENAYVCLSLKKNIICGINIDYPIKWI